MLYVISIIKEIAFAQISAKYLEQVDAEIGAVPFDDDHVDFEAPRSVGNGTILGIEREIDDVEQTANDQHLVEYNEHRAVRSDRRIVTLPGLRVRLA